MNLLAYILAEISSEGWVLIIGAFFTGLSSLILGIIAAIKSGQAKKESGESKKESSAAKDSAAAATVKATEAIGKAETGIAIGTGATHLAGTANDRSNNNAQSITSANKDLKTVLKAMPAGWFPADPAVRPTQDDDPTQRQQT